MESKSKGGGGNKKKGRGGNQQQPQQSQQQQSNVPKVEPAPPSEPKPPPSGIPSAAPSTAVIPARVGGGDAGASAARGVRTHGRRNMISDDSVVSRTSASKKGSSGKQVMLRSNYFRLKVSGGNKLSHYHVSVEPQAEPWIISKLIGQQRNVLGPYIFDGTQLFLYNRLKSDEVELQVKHPFQENELFLLKIKWVNTIGLTNEVAISIFNLMIRDAMKGLKLQTIGRNFYDPMARITISQYNLELYPGYLSSIRQHEKDLLMCTEIIHRVLRTETCYTMLKNLSRTSRNARSEFKAAVIGSVVMTTYNNRTYTIMDVDFDKNPNETFPYKDKQITFCDYYKEHYNLDIRDLQQPLLVSKSKDRGLRAGKSDMIFLVPELCRMTGLSDSMRSNMGLMRSIADYTRIGPDKRMERLEQFNRRLQGASDTREAFKFWRVELDNRLAEIEGRVLPCEKIYFCDAEIPAGDSADWSNAFRNNAMFKNVPLQRWCLLVKRNNEKVCYDFLQALMQTARGMRMQIQQPDIITMEDDQPNNYGITLQQVMQKDPQLILCVVSTDRPDRYSVIKKKCCVERAIPTQVVKLKTITPKQGTRGMSLSVATKIAIQINCKLGGIPWILRNPLSSVLIIGFDVCHDTVDKSCSYGALVATMYGGGQKEPRYFSVVEKHTKGEEMSNFLALKVGKVLHSYQQQFGTNALPLRVIMYRDGVGEGQLNYVVKHEVEVIKKTLDSIYLSVDPNTPARLTCIVVNKRINTRLFNGKYNPAPGTVVDDVITMPERNDFFLVSQSVRQGTVSPTSYNIIYDQSGLSPDQMQVYTFKQTHLYYNHTASVGVPAVCQYAHKLAFFTAQYLKQSPNAAMENRLYFL